MKDLKISKELLSEVLKLEVVKHSLYNELHKSFNITYMQSEDSLKSSWMPINVYEFTFKCKEWAFSKGYIVSSGLTPVLGVNKDGWAEVFNSSTPLDGKLHTFKQLSEIEAVFKACEWILESKDNK